MLLANTFQLDSKVNGSLIRGMDMGRWSGLTKANSLDYGATTAEFKASSICQTIISMMVISKTT